MNHIYRLVWNNAVRAWQPVSEFAAQTRGGRASAGLCAPMRWPRHALAVALALGLSGWSGMATAANCRNNGSRRHHLRRPGQRAATVLQHLYVKRHDHRDFRR